MLFDNGQAVAVIRVKFKYGVYFNASVLFLSIPSSYVSENGYASSRLRQVTVPVLSDAQCSDLVYSGYQRNTMLCAGLIAGGKDACQVCLTDL